MCIQDLTEIKTMLEVLEKEGATDIADRVDYDMKYVAYTTGTEFFLAIVDNLNLVRSAAVSETSKARAVKLQKDILSHIKIV